MLVLVYIANILACDYRCASCSYDSANPTNTLGICNYCKYGFDINNACKTCMSS
jgi:collagenase-like PrtC family protease